MATGFAAMNPKNVLEVACGTGILTREIVGALPDRALIVATDLSPDMNKLLAYVERSETAIPKRQAE